jgi:hypothetical protein
MKVSKFLLRLTVIAGAAILFGMPLVFAQDASTPIQTLEQRIEKLTQDIHTDRASLAVDHETVGLDRIALKNAEASGNAQAIKEAKEKLADDLEAERKATHDLDRDLKDRQEAVDILKDLKEVQKVKDKVADAKTQVDQIEAQVKLDVIALKNAEASGNPTAIKEAKEKLAGDHKTERQDKHVLEHARHVLKTLEKDIHHDRRQIKHGK